MIGAPRRAPRDRQLGLHGLLLLGLRHHLLRHVSGHLLGEGASHAWVEVQRADGGTWVPVSTFRASSGRVTISRIPAGATYRLVIPDAPMATGTTSNSVQM